MKKNYIILAVIAVIVLLIAVFKSPVVTPVVTIEEDEQGNDIIPTETGKTTTTKTGTSVPSKNAGRVVFTISDETVLSDATIQSVLLTINDISVHNSSGWVTVSKTPRAFDLVSLKATGRDEMMLDTNLNAGTYDQIRFSLGQILVAHKSGLNSENAKSRLQTINLNTKIVFEKGGLSGVSFDFDLAKSLHRINDGTLMFFPVLKLNTQHSIKTLQNLGGNVQFFEGLTDFVQSWGVDENGDIKVDFSFGNLTKIEFVGKVIRIIPYEEKQEDIKVGAQTILDTVIRNGYLSEVVSIQTIVRENKRIWKVVGIKSSARVTVYADISTGAVISVE